MLELLVFNFRDVSRRGRGRIGQIHLVYFILHARGNLEIIPMDAGKHGEAFFNGGLRFLNPMRVNYPTSA